MYVNSGYLNRSRVEFKDTVRPLVVGSAGTYRLEKHPVLLTQRPRGRVDYQLLYVAAGKAHFFFDDGKEDTVVRAGNMVLYRPGEMQKYAYCAEDNPEVFWVHFTGYDVQNILQSYHFNDRQRVFSTGTSPEYKRLFRQMIQELQLCKPMYEEILASILNHIFILINRQTEVRSSGSNQVQNEIEQAAEYFMANYNREIVIEDYAQVHHISVSWFIRSFKQYTRLTPVQYIQSIRLANAQSLLETTAYNMSEIAAIVGYDNSLYFSRLFKKQYGVSPLQYRNRKKTEKNLDEEKGTEA